MNAPQCNGSPCHLPHEHDDGACFFCVECCREMVRLCDEAVSPFRMPQTHDRRIVPIQERS